TELSKSLRLPSIRSEYDTIINQAVSSATAHDEFLLDVLRRENQSRYIENLRLAIEKTKQQSPHDVTVDKIIIVCQNICQGATAEPHRGDIEHSATAQLQEISRLLQSEPTGENTIINPSKLNNNECK
ncbi:MAG: hypothetical protein GY719_16345, partial [bacterium]|nr:hypothetical protein [bacterium]